MTADEIKALNSRNVVASTGLGDTVAKVAHAVGADKLAEKFTDLTGIPCGCDKRQELLNKLFPYSVKGED